MDLYATDNSYPAYSILIRDTKDIWGALKKRDSIWFLCQRRLYTRFRHRYNDVTVQRLAGHEKTNGIN